MLYSLVPALTVPPVGEQMREFLKIQFAARVRWGQIAAYGFLEPRAKAD